MAILVAAQAAGGELCVAMRAGLTPGTSGDDGFLSSWILNAFYLPRRDGAIAASLQRQFTTVP